MRRSKKRGKAKQNKKLIWLAVAVLVIGIGFAALQKYLNINGTASIDSSWDVSIVKAEVLEKTGTAYEKENVTYTDTTVTFNVGFVAPDDSITYDVEIANWGSINAKLDNITFEQTGSENITFELTGIKKGDLIAAGSSAHLSVKATYSGTTSEELSKSLTASLLFVQTNETTEEQESNIAEFQASKSEIINDYYFYDIAENSIGIDFSFGDGPGPRYNYDLINANNDNVILADGNGKGYRLKYFENYNLKTKEYMAINSTKIYNNESDPKSFYLMRINNNGATYIANRITENDLEVVALDPSYESNILELGMFSSYRFGFLGGTNVTTVVLPSGFDLSKLTLGSLVNYKQGSYINKVINQTGESINWGPILNQYEPYDCEDLLSDEGNIVGRSCKTRSLDCSFVTGTCGNVQITSE